MTSATASCVECMNPITDVANRICPACGKPWAGGTPSAQSSATPVVARTAKSRVSIGLIIGLLALVAVIVALTWAISTGKLGLQVAGKNVGAPAIETVWDRQEKIGNTEIRISNAEDRFECREDGKAWQAYKLSDIAYSVDNGSIPLLCGVLIEP